MDKPRDPVTVVFDRPEAVALLGLGIEDHYAAGIVVRARQRVRQELGTEELHRAVHHHRESRDYWPE